MSRKARTAAVTVVMALLVGAAAHAGTVKSGIFHYVTKAETIPSADLEGLTLAQCPDGTMLTGVGGSLPSTKDGDLTAIMPLDGQDEDGDRNDLGVTNGRWASGQGKIKLKSVAVCSSDLAGSLVHVSADEIVPSSSAASFTTSCPDDSYRVVGGGGGAQDREVSLRSSFPSTLWQWQIDVANASGAAKPVIVTIACLPPGVRGVFYDETDLDVPPAGSASVKVPCPEGTRVSGGGFEASGVETTARTSRPYDGKDRDTAPDDGWTVRAVNDNDAQVPTTIHAICVGAPLGG